MLCWQQPDREIIYLVVCFFLYTGVFVCFIIWIVPGIQNLQLSPNGRQSYLNVSFIYLIPLVRNWVFSRDSLCLLLLYVYMMSTNLSLFVIPAHQLVIQQKWEWSEMNLLVWDDESWSIFSTVWERLTNRPCCPHNLGLVKAQCLSHWLPFTEPPAQASHG